MSSGWLGWGSPKSEKQMGALPIQACRVLSYVYWYTAILCQTGLTHCGLVTPHCRTKPSPETMLTYYQWSPVKITWRQFHKWFLSYQLLKLVWKLLTWYFIKIFYAPPFEILCPVCPFSYIFDVRQWTVFWICFCTVTSQMSYVHWFYIYIYVYIFHCKIR